MKSTARRIGTTILYAGSLQAVSRLSIGSSSKLALSLVSALIYLLTMRMPGGSMRQWAVEHRLLVPALAFSVAILLLPGWGSSVVLALLAAAWLGCISTLKPQPALVALLNQFLASWAIFLAAGVWQWPDVIILLLTWSSSFLVARQMLVDLGEKAHNLLAGAWALICSQAAWVFTVWLVNYLLLGGAVIVPQPAIVLTALGYCFGGIYLAHLRVQLSRGRLAEYLLIGLSLLMIVIAGTKWNGSV